MSQSESKNRMCNVFKTTHLTECTRLDLISWLTTSRSSVIYRVTWDQTSLDSTRLDLPSCFNVFNVRTEIKLILILVLILFF